MCHRKTQLQSILTCENRALIIVIIVWFLGCLGLSDPTAASPRRAEILNVTFKSIAVDKHSYTVSWKPLENFPFVDGEKWNRIQLNPVWHWRYMNSKSLFSLRVRAISGFGPGGGGGGTFLPKTFTQCLMRDFYNRDGNAFKLPEKQKCLQFPHQMQLPFNTVWHEIFAGVNFADFGFLGFRGKTFSRI